MASSLRKQVDALRRASSGTSSNYIQKKKGKPSLLLTPDQAASLDLSSVRETAVMGLQRLEAVDEDFSPFQATLFSKEAEVTLRDLQTKEANERINQSISAFLALLSPHFSSREAHFCLEYLIRHYKVYQYNVDAVMECCLPWHDTLAFARLVQLLSLKGSRWEFLTPVQETGCPLPREAIARRCARDFGLLRFLCVSARKAAARAGSTSAAGSAVSAATTAGRAKLFSFYAAVVVEGLDSLGSASEPLLRAVVPSIVHGLSATRSHEYQMASYMILSALSGKGPLSSEVTSTALTALVCKPCQGGLGAPLLCALAVAQSQVGFSPTEHSSNTDSLLLPTPAFKKLSATETLASVLARLARKFDATAFLWLLLQSYVRHLADEDSGHGMSLVRLCTYPHWPSHSLPRLVRRLVGLIIRSYLASMEGAEDGMQVEAAPAKRRRSAAMKTESQRVLRVLGQRFPQEVDAGVAKISRSVAKTMGSTAKAALRAEAGSDDDIDDNFKAARRQAVLREKALASLLVCTFAGAQMAPRLPLEQQEEDNAGIVSGDVASGGVHGSLMVALEHSSAEVRARAVEQLSRAIAADAGYEAKKSAPAAVGGEDLSPLLLRRLHDEDPSVVLAITGSNTLVEQVLLRPCPPQPDARSEDGIEGVDFSGVASSSVNRAAAVASAAATAAVPWLSALSEAKPKHPVALSGKVLSGLLRLAASATGAAATAAGSAASSGDICEGGSAAVARRARDSALSLFLECLPGPHATARVKLAQQNAFASASGCDIDVSTGGVEAAAAAASAAAGKACKKAVRAVSRAAIEAVSGLSSSAAGVGVVGLFANLTRVLEEDTPATGKDSAKSPRKQKRKLKGGKVAAMEVEGGSKSKGLKVIGEDVCDNLASALVSASGDQSKMTELQALGEIAGAGGRWLVLESVSRAVNLASASSNSSNQNSRRPRKDAASRLAMLLVCSVTFELRLRPEMLASTERYGGEAGGGGVVGAAALLWYLRVCATHLPRPGRRSSLCAEDHLTVPAAAAESPTPDDGGLAAANVAPLMGDVLVSVLKANAAAPEGTGGKVVWEAVSAVMLHGYERRPLCALAAIAIQGASIVGQGRHATRHKKRRGGGIDGRVVVASRALCVAATFVRASAEVATAQDVIDDDDYTAAVEKDLVAAFPAAVLAVASNDENLRDGGLLFISTVAAHGDSFWKPRAKSTSAPAANAFSEEEASLFFPPSSEGQGQPDAAQPAPLKAPTLSSVVELASAISERNRESTLDAAELTRHLTMTLGRDANTVGGGGQDVLRYLVAWAARLGWRDPSGSARLLGCLSWAKTPMRECCLPLLHHCLDSEELRNDLDNVGLLKLLLNVIVINGQNADTVNKQGKTLSTKSPKNTARGSKGKDNAGSVAVTPPASTAAYLLFESVAAEKLMDRALRTPGQAQTLALRALASYSTTATSDGAGVAAAVSEEAVRQRRDLVLTLVEVGLAGADASLVTAAARALPVRPCDVAALLRGLVPTSTGTAASPKARKKQSSVKPKADATNAAAGWVLTLGGLVELAQALCGPSAASQAGKGRGGDRAGGPPATAKTADGWDWAAPLEIARPLFDALPALLAVATTTTPTAAEVGSYSPSFAGSATPGTAVAPVPPASVVDAAEYALWLTMDVLGIVLRRWGKGAAGGGGGSAAAERLYKGSRAGEDAERVLTCIRENPSPQTRNSGLALLSRMATLFPANMASQLRTLLDAVCGAAADSEGFSSGVGAGGVQAALRQTQKAVQSVVPALKAHGAEAGVGAHFVVQVFVDALEDAPAHARRALFSSLIESLGDESLAILAASLLRQAVARSSAVDDGASREREEETTALVDFVHQTVHCWRAHAQVRTLVVLVQACHRLSVSTAERSGGLSRQILEDAIEYFSDDPAVDGEQEPVDYLKLSLQQHRESKGGAEKSSRGYAGPAFMTMDLRALSEVTAADDGRKTIYSDPEMGIFLEEVLAFVRDHLVSKPLLMDVAAAAERAAGGGTGTEESEDKGIQEGFLLLCEELLLLLRTFSACVKPGSSNGGGSIGPSWSNLQGLAYNVFETLQSLLSVPSFVAVTQELLQHQDPHLRRKALQMFTRRLDPAGGAVRLNSGEESLFIDMLPSLRSVAMGKRADGSASIAEDDDAMGAGLKELMGPSSEEADVMKEDDGMEESSVNRQTALLSLDVLARVLGRQHQDAFVGVLGDVTEIVAGHGPYSLPAVGESGGEGILPLRASAFLLLATLCAVLGVRAFPQLPRFFPAMLQALDSTATGTGGGGQNLLWTSALSAVATVAAGLPSFLSPYLGRILAVSLRPAAAAAAGFSVGGGASAAGSKQAADRVLSLLAAGVEPRLLVPAVCGAYAGCVESAQGGEEEDQDGRVVAASRSVARLLAFVQEIVAGLEKDAASAALPQFTRILTQALDFRRQHASGSAPQIRASAELVESEASSALVGLVMKLSEVELRPLFLHLCEWKAGIAAGDNDPKATLGVLDRRLSFYRILDGLAGALKSIFTPYFAHVLTDCIDDMEAASVLASSAPAGPSATRKKRKRFEKRTKDEAVTKRKRHKTLSSGDLAQEGEDDEDEDGEEGAAPELGWRRSAASRLVLSALRRCFQSDRSGFVNKARFDLLLPAVVAQLECGSDYSGVVSAGGGSTSDPAPEQDEVSSCRLHAEELVGPCLAQLASASAKDALWKAMANAILMKTRSKRAGVKVAALVSLRQCFEVVGEEFLALLPECLPFLSELLEDGHPEVESECRALVKLIEGILGESIESYLV